MSPSKRIPAGSRAPENRAGAEASGLNDASRLGALLPVKPFSSPKRSIGALDAEVASVLLTAAADIAIVLDRQGIVQDVAFNSDELSSKWSEGWLGKPWTGIVTVESRPKVEALLREASAAPSRSRHVNHFCSQGPDVPVLYSAIQLGTGDRVVAVGRDLRAVASLQQRLVEVQQSMERDYSRLRHVETRYRLLFQMTSEAILMVDAATSKVAEANPAAIALLSKPGRGIVGRPVSEGLDPASARDLQAGLAGVRATGRPLEVRLRTAAGKRELIASASVFRQETNTLYLIRLTPAEDQPRNGPAPDAHAKLLRFVESATDGVAVTDSAGRVLAVNSALLDLAQLATEEQAVGESLDRWLGRPGVDLGVLIANLRQHGSVRLYPTTWRGEYGTALDVEVAAVQIADRDEPTIGFSIRDISRRYTPESKPRELPRSVEQLTELVGRVPLKDLVRETTDVIERLCIEAALDLTGDNRASAADMLGLSRQSLYVKLRRYGLGDLGPEDAG